MRSICRHALLTKTASLLRDRSGVAAIEFAMILPLMLIVFLGSVDVTRGVAIDRKVGLVARTVADLTSQSSVLTNSQMTNILNASTVIVAPYTATPLKVVVTAVNIDGSGNAKVSWSRAKNGAPRTAGSTVSLPSAISVPNTQIIWGEASYTYAPLFTYLALPSMNLSEQNFVRPRETGQIPNPS